jgi:hypothetical protein
MAEFFLAILENPAGILVLPLTRYLAHITGRYL